MVEQTALDRNPFSSLKPPGATLGIEGLT